MKHSTSRDGVTKKPETVAERAVRGALAGYIYSERTIVRIDDESVGTNMPGSSVFIGYRATVEYFVPVKSINDMLRRERAQARSNPPRQASPPRKRA